MTTVYPIDKSYLKQETFVDKWMDCMLNTGVTSILQPHKENNKGL